MHGQLTLRLHYGNEPQLLCSGRCIRETERGLKVLRDDNVAVWLPRVAVHHRSEVRRNGDVGRVLVLAWFARMLNQKAQMRR